MPDHLRGVLSRRGFVGGSAAIAATCFLPTSGRAAAKYRRWKITDPNCPKRVIESYKTAVKAMLLLPPSDPRNWYRHALIHTLDCPHGNWWFLPWHRGYLGYLEQICRDLSGDPEFAFPYWDWTEEPRVPDVMFEGVMDPADPAFIASAKEFKAQFSDAIAKSDYWSMTTDSDGQKVPSASYSQLLARSIRFPDDLWFDVANNPTGLMFFDRQHARGLSRADPDLKVPGNPNEQPVLKAVSLPTLLDALGPRDFLTFGSPKSVAHSSTAGFSILEGQPHNQVHNCVGGAYNGNGGFMQALLSSVDPLFFLHHANLDRIWDVWTRKQVAMNRPIFPDGYPENPTDKPPPGSDYQRWADEQFVFFVDQNGKKATKTSAGDFSTIGDFNYDYSPGSGEEIVPVAPGQAVAEAERSTWPAALTTQSRQGLPVTVGEVTVPSAALEPANRVSSPLAALVTIDLTALQHHQTMDVFLQPTNGPAVFVANIAMFGHHAMEQNATFLVPISTAIQQVSDKNAGANTTFSVFVQPSGRPHKDMTMNAINGQGRPAAESISAISLVAL